jgi:hypothetical protein
MGSGAAEGLQQVLERLFLEAQFKQKQQEHGDRMSLGWEESGQRSRGLDIQEEGNRINAGLRDAQIKATEAERLRQDEDRNIAAADRQAGLDVRKGEQLQGNLRLMPKGTPIDNPDMLVEMGKRGLGGMLKPVQNEPRFEFAGTQDAENKDANIASREGALDERERHNRRMEELSAARTNAPVIQIHTTDANGNAVTKVVPRNQAAGQEFAAGPTTDDRNRRSAARRAAGVIEAVGELSERINVNQGAMATIKGAAEIQKAKINLNDDISEYNGVVQGFTPMLARALGHTGVLTEQDVQSTREALPNPKDSKNVRDRKMARITSLLDTGLQGRTLSDALKDQPEGGSPATAATAADLIQKYRKK